MDIQKNLKEVKNQVEVYTPLEKQVNFNTPIIDAFEVAKQYNVWSTNTIKAYSKAVEKLVGFLIQKKINPTIGVISKDIVLLFKKHLVEILGEKDNTVKNRLRALSSIFCLFHDEGIINKNPFKNIKIKITNSRTHSRHLSVEDQKLIYLAVEKMKYEKGIDIEVNVKFALATAARVVTLNSIKVKHINFEQQILVFTDTSSTKNHLIMPLGPSMTELLKKYVKKYGLTQEDILLRDLKGGPLKEKQFNYMIKLLCNYVGWEGESSFSPHGFRATFATRLKKVGAEHALIRFGLSHSEKSTLGDLEPYIRLKPELIEEMRFYVNMFEQEMENFTSENHYLIELPTFKDVKNVLKNNKTFKEASVQRNVLSDIDPQILITLVKLLQQK